MLAPRSAVLILLLVPAFAFAQAERAPAPADAEAPKKVEKIEVIAPDAVSERRESTAAKIVVDREEITKYGDTSVLDVMKQLPGVTVNRGSVAMRGLGGYTQILVNGELTIGGNFNARAGGTVRTSGTQVSYSSVTRSLETYGLWKLDAKTQLRITVGNVLAPDAMSVSRYFDATQSAELTSVNPGYRRIAALLEVKL